MIREEAIKQLKELIEHLKNDMYADDKKALEMAIQALLQEPCQLLIIKSDILLHQDDTKKWMDNIKRGKADGVIILPPYFEPLLVPDNIEIKMVEPQESEDKE